MSMQFSFAWLSIRIAEMQNKLTLTSRRSNNQFLILQIMRKSYSKLQSGSQLVSGKLRHLLFIVTIKIPNN